MYRYLLFDLDGTLTQHKTPLSKEHRDVLTALSKNKLIYRSKVVYQFIINFTTIFISLHISITKKLTKCKSMPYYFHGRMYKKSDRK